ncbi:MAG TPA: type II toxin-antitoxin system CcdA family antitoxin [Azospirillum sp.]
MPKQEEPVAKAERSDGQRAWLTENAEAITYQNRLCEEEGAFGDDVRSF